MSNLIGFFVATLTVLGIMLLVSPAAPEPTPDDPVSNVPVPDDLAKVLANLESDDDPVRLEAIMALGNFPDHLNQTAPLAAKFSAELDPLESTAGYAAIDRMGPEMLNHLEPSLRSDNLLLVDGACNAFGRFGEQPEGLAQPLFDLVNSQDANRIFSGLKALQGMGKTAKPQLDRLIELLDHENFNVQLRACNVLSALGSDAEPALEALLRLSTEGNPSARSSTLPALGAIGTVSDDPRILETLKKNLNAFLALAKERAMIGICRMGPRATPLLDDIQRLMDDKTKSVMPEAAYARWCVTQEIEPTLTSLRKHAASHTYRDRVLEQIARIGPAAHSMTDVAITGLGSPEASTRDAAVTALQKIGPKAKAALPELRKVAADDSDLMVRHAAQRAVEQLESE